MPKAEEILQQDKQVYVSKVQSLKELLDQITQGFKRSVEIKDLAKELANERLLSESQEEAYEQRLDDLRVKKRRLLDEMDEIESAIRSDLETIWDERVEVAQSTLDQMKNNFERVKDRLVDIKSEMEMKVREYRNKCEEESNEESSYVDLLREKSMYDNRLAIEKENTKKLKKQLEKEAALKKEELQEKIDTLKMILEDLEQEAREKRQKKYQEDSKKDEDDDLDWISSSILQDDPDLIAMMNSPALDALLIPEVRSPQIPAVAASEDEEPVPEKQVKGVKFASPIARTVKSKSPSSSSSSKRKATNGHSSRPIYDYLIRKDPTLPPKVAKTSEQSDASTSRECMASDPFKGLKTLANVLDEEQIC